MFTNLPFVRTSFQVFIAISGWWSFSTEYAHYCRLAGVDLPEA
jgi:hypothetical protein